MRAFGAVFRAEILRRRRDPLSTLIWLFVPLVLVALMVAVFSPRGGGLPAVKMLLVDHDESAVSRFLTGALGGGQLAELIEPRVLPQAEAEQVMDRGEASLMVVIPAGFGEAVLGNEPASLEVFRNPQQTILPGIGESVVEFLTDAGTMLRGTLQPLFEESGLDLRQQPSEAAVTAFSATVYRLLRDPAASSLLDPQRVKVSIAHPPEEKRLTRSEVVGWFAPGFLILSLVFLAGGQTQEIQEDLASGRMARLISFPVRPGVVLLAKAAALLVSLLLTSGLLLAGYIVILGWWPGPPLAVALHLVAAAAALEGLALFLRSLTRRPEAGNAASSGILVGLGFLGGCFIPVVFLPQAVRPIADWIPTGWAVQGLNVLQGASWAGASGGVAWRTAALSACAVTTFLLAAYRMRDRVELH